MPSLLLEKLVLSLVVLIGVALILSLAVSGLRDLAGEIARPLSALPAPY